MTRCERVKDVLNKRLAEEYAIPLLVQLLHEEFVRGYERGKSDERDAKSIDEALKDELAELRFELKCRDECAALREDEA